MTAESDGAERRGTRSTRRRRATGAKANVIFPFESFVSRSGRSRLRPPSPHDTTERRCRPTRLQGSLACARSSSSSTASAASPPASASAFRYRVSPVPAQTAPPSACRGSARAASPWLPTGRDGRQEAASSPDQSVSFNHAPCVTTRKPSKTRSSAAIAFPVAIRFALPETANSTGRSSNPSGKFGRHGNAISTRRQTSGKASSNAVRSVELTGAAASNPSF